MTERGQEVGVGERAKGREERDSWGEKSERSSEASREGLKGTYRWRTAEAQREPP